jgi:hypothetical protein
VGLRDPLPAVTVMAIFDLGSCQPFVVWWRPDDGRQEGRCEVLGTSAYSAWDLSREYPRMINGETIRLVVRRLSRRRLPTGGAGG